eukprot:356724-Chlamydomonas_euryale.AAC.1
MPAQPWRHSVEVRLVMPLLHSAAGRSAQTLRPGEDKTDYRERRSDTPCTPNLCKYRQSLLASRSRLDCIHLTTRTR